MSAISIEAIQNIVAKHTHNEQQFVEVDQRNMFGYHIDRVYCQIERPVKVDLKNVEIDILALFADNNVKSQRSPARDPDRFMYIYCPNDSDVIQPIALQVSNKHDFLLIIQARPYID